MRATLKAVRSKCGASVVRSSDIAIRRRSCAVDMRSSLRLCDHTVLGRERAKHDRKDLLTEPRSLRHDASLLLAQLGREGLAEVVGLEHRADLDLAWAGHRVRAVLHPCDRLFHVLDLPQPKPGDELAGFGEGPVDHGTAYAVEGHALALRRRLQALAGQHDAGLD